MAINFADYFTSIAPAEVETLTNDSTYYLPDLKAVEPTWYDTWGHINRLYYNTSSSNLTIPGAVYSFTKESAAVGAYVILFRIPMIYPDSGTILCYFGARLNFYGSGSSKIYSVTIGYFANENLSEAAGYQSTAGASGDISVQTNYHVGISFLRLPTRDGSAPYTNAWDKYVIGLWSWGEPGWGWDSATDFRLKSTNADSTGNYLESNSGSLSYVNWYDLGEFSLNHNGAGPIGYFYSDFSPEVGPASEPDGYGQNVVVGPPSFDDSSDTIDLPTVPALGVANVGFVRVYKTGSMSLQNIGIELFPPLQYTPPTPITATDTTDAIINGFNSIVTFLANIPSFFDQMVANTLINYVIDCHIIPVTPTNGTTEPIQVGWKTLLTSASRVTSDYVDVSCGSISIREYYAGFADFLTTAKLYLPFIGFVPVRPEWFQSDTLKVDYRFNIIDGSFTVYVRSGGRYVNNGDTTGTIVGQYSGNACVHLPITGVTYASMVSGLVGAAGGMAAATGSGAIAAAATSAIGAATTHGDIAQSNAYTSSAAFLSCRKPFLMIERPVSDYSKNFQHEVGLPANVYAKLGDVPGFVKMENVHVDGISGATSAEKEEIRRLLANGVIV